ncbi:MAG TPA: PIG-L deacetylase family protein [Gemmatimonadaceae bacterium]|nr:PIG-L deacetylase family protein [Gemmatimonadaceae bacterium]
MKPRHPALLAVFAHPDDELFHGGILAHLAERGARVQLLCMTHGEAGRVKDPALEGADLPRLRTEELRLSCERLGIDPPVILDFHDSGRLDHFRRDDARALANTDLLEAESAVRAVIGRVKPQVILTHDPHGGYLHPDHLATHRVVTAAFFSSGVMGDEAPDRLVYGTLALDVARVFVSHDRGPARGLDPEVMGVADSTIAYAFDARPYMDRKLAALAAHRSQFGLTLETLDNPPPPRAEMLRAFRPVFEREVFMLGGSRGALPSWPMKDLFEGLAVTAAGDGALQGT